MTGKSEENGPRSHTDGRTRGGLIYWDQLFAFAVVGVSETKLPVVQLSTPMSNRSPPASSRGRQPAVNLLIRFVEFPLITILVDQEPDGLCAGLWFACGGMT
jgi:hypothetical protein